MIATTGAVIPLRVDTLRVLGHGRAAEARLVRASISGESPADDGEPQEQGLLCVEKVFRPGLLTRLIYRVTFQAPFAYQSNTAAILASFYRRRVAAGIVRAMLPEAAVAPPLYVRWDRASQALVLASEYIRGRGIVPAPADPGRIRRGLATLFGRQQPSAAAPAEEIDELLELMTRLETLLIQCGLTGSGWQVCSRAMVSTANLLRTDSGYVVVDLESGIPSVLVPHYLLAGLRLGSVPLFDDLDADRLRHWLGDNRPQLAAALGETDLAQLEDDVQRLIDHTEDWKGSELALGRQPRRLLSRDFYQRLKTQVLDSWRRREIIDPQHESALRGEGRFFTGLTFLLGLIPGPIGRCCQRLWANASYRQQASRFVSDSVYRSEVSSRLMSAKAEAWHARGRISAAAAQRWTSARFAANWLLSKLTPTVLHRLVVDPVYRSNRLLRMFLFCVSGSFQSRFGRLWIQSRIEHWRRSERLSPAEADSLHRQLDSRAVDEYVRCFGLHVGLKLLLPVVMSLKVGGAAASVASGNPFYFLFMLMLLPMLRTGVTLWRMLASGQPAADFRDALVVGALPVVGSLAYPVQMYAKFSGLSLFLLRDFAGRVGCWLPIYGGKDSRTELTAIKAVDLLAEGLELWLTATAYVPARRGHDAGSKPADGLTPSLTIGRWDRLIHQQLELLTEEAGLASGLGKSASENARRQDLSGTKRRAA